MKSKAPLLLMEQMVMLLVFALAAALCLQAFVKSDGISKDSENRDRAAMLCQNAAEALHHSGSVEAALTELHGEVYEQEGVYYSFYDEDWNYLNSIPGCGTGRPEAVYRLEVRAVDSGVKGLGNARVEAVAIQDGAVVFALDVAWQEEDGELSRRSEDRDRAAALCQNAAETFRGLVGYADGLPITEAAEELGYHCAQGIMWQEFDEEWNPVDYGVYRLEAQGIPAEDAGHWAAHVCVSTGYNVGQEMEVLYEIEVAWPMEVSGNGR